MTNSITKLENGDFKVESRDALKEMFEYGFEVARKLEFPMLKGKKNETNR